MASLQAFLSFLPRAPKFPLPLLTPAKQATTVMCLLPVQDICSELLLVLHIKYTPHLQKKNKFKPWVFPQLWTYVSLLHRLNTLSWTFRLSQGTG